MNIISNIFQLSCILIHVEKVFFITHRIIGYIKDGTGDNIVHDKKV